MKTRHYTACCYTNCVCPRWCFFRRWFEVVDLLIIASSTLLTIIYILLDKQYSHNQVIIFGCDQKLVTNFINER